MAPAIQMLLREALEILCSGHLIPLTPDESFREPFDHGVDFHIEESVLYMFVSGHIAEEDYSYVWEMLHVSPGWRQYLCQVRGEACHIVTSLLTLRSSDELRLCVLALTNNTGALRDPDDQDIRSVLQKTVIPARLVEVATSLMCSEAWRTRFLSILDDELHLLVT
jgi:hypothetical protein